MAAYLNRHWGVKGFSKKRTPQAAKQEIAIPKSQLTNKLQCSIISRSSTEVLPKEIPWSFGMNLFEI